MTTLIAQIGIAWFVAILAGMPIFASMALAAFAFVHFGDLPHSIVPQKMAQAVNSFPIVAAPIFILMGNILTAARINDKIVAFATALVGWLRGGYAHASIVASMRDFGSTSASFWRIYFCDAGPGHAPGVRGHVARVRAGEDHQSALLAVHFDIGLKNPGRPTEHRHRVAEGGQ